MQQTNIQRIYSYLEDAGWSELIDSRWRDDVIKEIHENLPDVSDNDIEHVLNIILI